MGHRMGCCRNLLYRAFLVPPGLDRVARHVLDRHLAVAAGVLYSAARPEPEISRRTRAQKATAGHGSRFLDIFSPALLRTTLLASLLAVGAQGGYYAITTWLPTYLKTTRGLSVLEHWRHTYL